MEDIERSLIKIEEKLTIFKGLTKEEKNTNRFLLKTSLSDLILFTQYIIYNIGETLNIKVLPSESLNEKIKKINFWDENFFINEEKDFLKKIIKQRNRLSHNDIYFPNLNITESLFKQFKNYIPVIRKKAQAHTHTIEFLGKRIAELEALLKKVKDILSIEKHEVVDEYLSQINFAKRLPQSNPNTVRITWENIYAISQKIRRNFPFTFNFLKTILKYSAEILGNPILLFNQYFSDNNLCPCCHEEDSLTENFSLCDYWSSGEVIQFYSFSPFQAVKIDSKLIALPEFCDEAYEEECFLCHQGEVYHEIEPPPNSLFCVECGFYYLAGDRAGIFLDY